MAANTGATFLRLTLGAELARLREKKGLSGDEAARETGCAPSTISKIEQGTTGFRLISQFIKLLDVYDVDDDGQELLVDWYKNAKGNDWWTPNSSVLPSGMPAYLGFESGATKVSPWCPSVIYGLLQTEAYAEALMESAKAADETTTDFIESSVQVRMNRKKRITEEGLELDCIMDEAALRNMVGAREIMHRQYEELAMLSQLPNVSVRIIPWSARAYRVTAGSFTVMDFDRTQLPGPVVSTSTVSHTVQVVSKLKVVKRFARRFDFLSRSAVPDHEIPQFLERLAREV
ncbi:helix-turn-helix domain-containing protein [Streptomyces sp. NPDC059003]|uniref:helix-turn-helix domain-containing protein n=1 Tax=Streptomyces sp. NPDC059003 TaxID=3346691 RepID=UPI0036AC11AC